jgi:chemosensory pili system protein ChpA (sensor histidine kinase/response regulator)
MSGFSIDDVRDTLNRDVGSLLGEVERAAGEIASACADGAAGGLEERFVQIEHGGHAIYGSTSLVGAGSLSSSARLLEELSQRGAEALRLSQELARRAREAALLCSAGVGQMRELLALELDHRGPEATEAGRGWQDQVRAFLAQPPARAAAAEEAPASKSAPAPVSQSTRSSDRQFAAELADVFREEVAETRAALDEQLLLLAASPGDAAALGRVERLLHTLKGAAATVGLVEVSAAAATLREDVEALLDEGSPLSADQLETIRSRTSDLLASAGAQRLAPPPPAAPRAEPVSEVSRISSPASGTVRTEVPTDHDPELRQAFVQECAELTDELDRAILGLEESDDPRSLLAEILRSTHTLKGVVNTMGLAPTGALLHQLEDFLEELREAQLLPSMHSLGSVLLEIQAAVRRNLATAPEGYVETEPGKLDDALALLRRGESPAAEAPHSASASGTGEAQPLERRYIRVETSRLDGLMNLVGELVVSRSRLLTRVEALRSTQGDLARGYQRLSETVDAFREEHEFARAANQATPALRVANQAAPALRVAGAEAKPGWAGFSDLELDNYEDVQVLARSISEISSDFEEVLGHLTRGLGTLVDDADQFGSIVGGIQGEVTRARMVPLELLFARLRLPLREAATRENKEVRVVLEGETVSVDKTIADALLPPMLHLVRNAVAHGIEDGDARERAGKPRAGTVSLRARQQSGQIVLEVCDDGGGLDLAALHARGVEMGLVSADLPLTDPAVKELVFANGLSTSLSAGAVSGRGVGGDIVRRSVERLNGTIAVDTEAGKGTTFTLTLPLTLAIIKTMLVRAGGRAFAVPMSFADRLIEESEVELLSSAGQERVKLEGGYVGLVSLQGLLEGIPLQNTPGPVLILRVGEQRLALRVDGVVGQEEAVVKSLGPVLGGHPLFAGVTQRGTGELLLILDAPRLVESRAPRATSRLDASVAPPVPRSAPPPVRSSAPPPAASAPPKTIRLAAPVPKRTRVLFADDSISVRKMAEKILRDLGVEVTTAVDGLDALEKLREGGFDLLFTDLEMPRMHGYELIRELRFLPAFRALPIVVVTSRSSRKHEQQAMALGASEYVAKPFSSDSIKALLERWTKPAQQGGRS